MQVVTIKNHKRQIDGVIGVNFDMERFRNLLQTSKLPAGSTYLIVDHNGVIISRGLDPSDFIGKLVTPERLKIMQVLPDGGTYTAHGIDGIERFSCCRKLYLKSEQEPYMYINASIPVEEIVAKANRSLFFNLLRLSPFIIIVLFLTWLIGKYSVVDRVTLLVQAAQRLARGDLNARVAEHEADDELGTLGQTFDAMADQLALRERELRESKDLLNTIIETEPECIKLLAADGSLLMMNRAGLDMIQVESFDQVKGRSIYEVIDPEYLEAFKAMTKDVFNGKPGSLIFKIVGVKGRPLWVETHSVPLRNCNGEIVSLLGITLNITERKEMDRIKDEMISAVSHEMRTPLTAMLGYIEFILGNKVDEAQTKEYLEIVRKETERLKELISNFLDMQRFSAKKEGHNFKPLAVSPLLEEAATLFANASNKHRITVDAITELPLVIGNEEDLHTVLNNLISNAIKYSPKGGNIVLGAQREDSRVVLWVKDEGVGISEEEQGKIFDRFYRVDNTDRRNTSGTGLGLALVKEIVRAHGGQVWIESAVWKGSTFYISLIAANDKDH